VFVFRRQKAGYLVPFSSACRFIYSLLVLRVLVTARGTDLTTVSSLWQLVIQSILIEQGARHRSLRYGKATTVVFKLSDRTAWVK